MAELEYDIPASATAAWSASKADVEPEADGALMLADEEGDDDEECDEGCGCEEEDPLASGEATEDAPEADTEVSPESQDGVEDPTSAGDEPGRGKEKASKRSKSQVASDRLKDLAKPRKVAEPEPSKLELPQPKEKKVKKMRPSLLLRLKPKNLEEAYEAFFSGGFKEAPQFAYSFPEEEVAKAFEENSNVCFELMPEAKRILQKVHDEHGGPDAFMAKLYGEEKVPAEEMASTVAAYLREHNIEDKVEIRIVDSMLSAANVVKPGENEKYVVNIANSPFSKSMVQGICDHEVGTHLLRMMNDEHQVWHGKRDRYKLMNPWTTEEGFATLNTYQSLPTKLLYPQALRYFAVCSGAQMGFVELFAELQKHVSSPKSCWQMCCRIKRGMTDTSKPGAFYMDQAYFKGAVEILRHLDEVDFGRLYGGQVALQDLDKVHFMFRRDCVRLPCFMNSAEKLKTYMSHCRRLIKENGIETAVERVCKRVFVSTARELFKTKSKSELRAASAMLVLGGTLPPDKLRDSSTGPRLLDAQRLEDLSRPRPLVQLEQEMQYPSSAKKIDHARIVELAMPKLKLEFEEPAAAASAKPRKDGAEPLRSERPGSAPSAGRRDRSRPPLPKADVEPPPPPPPRPVDLARLASLAVPRKACEEATKGQPCGCPPKRRRKKKRRSKHRILAMVQAKSFCRGEDVDASLMPDDVDEEAGEDSGSDDDDVAPVEAQAADADCAAEPGSAEDAPEDGGARSATANRALSELARAPPDLPLPRRGRRRYTGASDVATGATAEADGAGTSQALPEAVAVGAVALAPAPAACPEVKRMTPPLSRPLRAMARAHFSGYAPIAATAAILTLPLEPAAPGAGAPVVSAGSCGPSPTRPPLPGGPLQTAPQAGYALPPDGTGHGNPSPASLLMAALDRQDTRCGSTGTAAVRARRQRPSVSVPLRRPPEANADGPVRQAVRIKTLQLDLGF